MTLNKFFVVITPFLLWGWLLKTPVQEVSILNPVSTPKLVLVTKVQILANARSVARQKGISEELFIKILLRESGAFVNAVGDIDIPYKGCRSRGIFQINSCYWPDIPDEKAFDAAWSILWAAERFKEGRVDLWTTSLPNYEL